MIPELVKGVEEEESGEFEDKDGKFVMKKPEGKERIEWKRLKPSVRCERH